MDESKQSLVRQRGGRRPGAGRKRLAEPKIPVCLRLEKFTLDHLDAIARKLSRSRSATVSSIILEFVIRLQNSQRRRERRQQRQQEQQQFLPRPMKMATPN
jgi:hypothetical protein